MSDRVPSYVDADRLCFELSISADTLDRWVKAGRLPAPKTGASSSKRRLGRVPRGVKRLWSWQEVRDRIDGQARSAQVSHDLGQEIESYARAATQGSSHR